MSRSHARHDQNDVFHEYFLRSNDGALRTRDTCSHRPLYRYKYAFRRSPANYPVLACRQDQAPEYRSKRKCQTHRQQKVKCSKTKKPHPRDYQRGLSRVFVINLIVILTHQRPTPASETVSARNPRHSESKASPTP